MSRSKQKGTAHETAIVRWLHLNGWPSADRSPLRGNQDKGDITGIPGVCIEAKNCKAFTPSVWLDELAVEMANASAETGVVIAKRRGTTNVDDYYAILPARLWLELLIEARPDYPWQPRQ